jgi:hypothetical protein
MSTDVGQGDDWPWIGIGYESGAGREDFGRETVYRL